MYKKILTLMVVAVFAAASSVVVTAEPTGTTGKFTLQSPMWESIGFGSMGANDRDVQLERTEVSGSPVLDFDFTTSDTLEYRMSGTAFDVGPNNVSFGSAVGTVDVSLSRGAANRLDLATGDTFNIVSGALQIGATEVIDSSGNLDAPLTLDDSEAITLGTGSDATIQYDGSDLLVNSQSVGSGDLIMTAGNLGLEGATPDGNEAFIAAADVSQDTTVTIPDIASGSATMTEFTTSICTGPLVTGSVDTMGFIATRAYTILDIDEVHSTAESAGTVGIMPERLQGTEAIASGDDLLTGAFDGTATANTVQNGTLSATTTLSAGDRIALDFTDDTPGELLNVCVSIRLRAN